MLWPQPNVVSNPLPSKTLTLQSPPNIIHVKWVVPIWSPFLFTLLDPMISLSESLFGCGAQEMGFGSSTHPPNILCMRRYLAWVSWSGFSSDKDL